MTNYFLEETEQLNFGRNGTEGRGVVPGAGEVSEIASGHGQFQHHHVNAE